MNIGTKSILYGAHAFWLHPFFVALAWWKLYGFPFHPYLWLCFFVHDIGYWGKPNMDGPEGETHPVVGARIVDFITRNPFWGNFCEFHSRHYAKRAGCQYSRLCVADKYATALTPAFIYIPLVKLTGEIDEYMVNGRKADPGKVGVGIAVLLRSENPWHWYRGLRLHMQAWALAHKDLKTDTVTCLESRN